MKIKLIESFAVSTVTRVLLASYTTRTTNQARREGSKSELAALGFVASQGAELWWPDDAVGAYGQLCITGTGTGGRDEYAKSPTSGTGAVSIC